uniref:Titin n=1 Tax=Glossina austeni TaxID=7395 RepID=A0A1A9VJ46_GLOAU
MGNQQGKLQHHNQSGRPKKNVHWKTAERPSPPGRPMLIPLPDQQPDVISLRFERPKVDGGSPITGYVVEHRRMGSPHWVRATPTPITLCEVCISGLEPGWRYQFRVFAENIVGRSEPSELSDILTVTLQRNAISVPRFINELEDKHVVEDERIEFRVRFLGQPPPEINWFKDGYEIFSSRRTKIVNDSEASVLIIHQVALTDEGEIKCTATNRAGHVVTKAHLFVQAPPKIRLPRTYEDGLIVEAQEVLRLKVGVAGQPPPIVTWFHEGEPVINRDRFEIINSERNSMLKIDNIHREDRGEYDIRASNKLGEDTASFLVTVTARPNPPGKVRLNMSFGKSATLSWTTPIDDGGCKIGNYIVEYFRVGWNVWLKAATTRSLSTTLHDLIEGSEYKFRVKAENPYGLSDPSEESEILFIPDPKRGITKPKSAVKLIDNKIEEKPVPPRRKTLSPPRSVADAATETLTFRISPRPERKYKPQLLDSEDLHREMSYGMPDRILKQEIHKSPSPFANGAKSTESPNKLIRLNVAAPPKKDEKPVKISPTKVTESLLNISKSPQLSPTMASKRIEIPTPSKAVNKSPQLSPSKENAGKGSVKMFQNENKENVTSKKEKQSLKKIEEQSNETRAPKSSPTKDIAKKPALFQSILKPKEKSPSKSKQISTASLEQQRNDSLSPESTKGTVAAVKSFPLPNDSVQRSLVTALERSAESAEMNDHQSLRRYSNHALSPPRNIPDQAVAIVSDNLSNTTESFKPSTEQSSNSNAPARKYSSHALSPARNVPNLAIAIATSNLGNAIDIDKQSIEDTFNDFGKDNGLAYKRPTLDISAPATMIAPLTPETLASPTSALSPEPSEMASPNLYQANNDKHDDVHTSNEFMLVVFNKSSKVKDNKDKQDSFELDLEDAIQPPPISISAPDLALLEYTTLHTTFPIRRSVSSTELLYERAMARFYEAVELEEAEKARKLKIAQDKLTSTTNIQPSTMRKRLGSMTEAERLSFEKRSELRRQSADITYNIQKWSSKENVNETKPITRATPMVLNKRQESQESEEYSEEYPEPNALQKDDSFELGSDYTESTASSDEDSIAKFKMELIARTRSPSPRELETYHPRNMTAGIFTPYRTPTPDEAALVLTRPVPLPSPDFVPKPILKRPSNENVGSITSSDNGNANNKMEQSSSEKLDIAKGIKAFFKRDKQRTNETEKNTEENEMLSNPQEKSNISILAAEIEKKRRAKEEEELRKRQEAERIMMEEAHAAADHYSELVHLVSTTRKYHTPIYMDQEELKKVTAKAAEEGEATGEDEENEDINPPPVQAEPQPVPAPPATNNKPKLRISEKEQVKYVSNIPTDLAVNTVTAETNQLPEASSENNLSSQQPKLSVVPPIEDQEETIETTILSETVEERPDSRGRPRLIKVKRILKKRVPSSTRSRDTSLSRPPSQQDHILGGQQRVVSRTRRSTTAESRSPVPTGRQILPLIKSTSQTNEEERKSSSQGDIDPVNGKTHEQLLAEAHENVRSAVSYSTDLILFMVACYVYLFKDARLVLPILALMIYRQLGEAINKCIPNWLKRKKQ